MRLELIQFKGEPVGIVLHAEGEQEQVLLWSLRNLPAKASETFGSEYPYRLVLCPQLPWRNLGDQDIPSGVPA